MNSDNLTPARKALRPDARVTSLERVMLRQIEAQENQHRREVESGQAILTELFKLGNRCIDVVERTELLRQTK